MKNEIFILAFCLLSSFLSAQQSVDTLINCTKVQKKIFIVRKSEAKESFVRVEANLTDTEIVQTGLTKKAYKSLPKMVSDKDGLLNQVYLQMTEDTVKVKITEPHVIMSLTISEFGYISEIIVHDYSESELVDIILKKFEHTHWKAAKDSNGKNTDYTYQKIAVVMPIVIKPAERED